MLLKYLASGQIVSWLLSSREALNESTDASVSACTGPFTESLSVLLFGGRVPSILTVNEWVLHWSFADLLPFNIFNSRPWSFSACLVWGASERKGVQLSPRHQLHQETVSPELQAKVVHCCNLIAVQGALVGLDFLKQDPIQSKHYSSEQTRPCNKDQDAMRIKMQWGPRCNEDKDSTRIKMQWGWRCNQVQDARINR